MKKVKQFFSEVAQLFKNNTAHMIAVVFISMILGAALFGGGGSSDQPTKELTAGDSVSDSQAENNVDVSQQQEQEQEQDNTIGDYTVNVVSHRIEENISNEPIIIVKYSFTNNSDEAAAFDWTIEDHAFQNGIELQDDIFVDADDYDSSLSYAEIKPGVTLEFEKAYTLRDNSTDVVIELAEYSLWSEDPIEFTIKIA